MPADRATRLGIAVVGVLAIRGDGDGAVIGRHRVRVGPPSSEAFPGYKCACVLNSEVDVMEVEVKKGEKNHFELVLKKKTGREAKPLPDD